MKLDPHPNFSEHPFRKGINRSGPLEVCRLKIETVCSIATTVVDNKKYLLYGIWLGGPL